MLKTANNIFNGGFSVCLIGTLLFLVFWILYRRKAASQCEKFLVSCGSVLMIFMWLWRLNYGIISKRYAAELIPLGIIFSLALFAVDWFHDRKLYRIQLGMLVLATAVIAGVCCFVMQKPSKSDADTRKMIVWLNQAKESFRFPRLICADRRQAQYTYYTGIPSERSITPDAASSPQGLRDTAAFADGILAVVRKRDYATWRKNVLAAFPELSAEVITDDQSSLVLLKIRNTFPELGLPADRKPHDADGQWILNESFIKVALKKSPKRSEFGNWQFDAPPELIPETDASGVHILWPSGNPRAILRTGTFLLPAGKTCRTEILASGKHGSLMQLFVTNTQLRKSLCSQQMQFVFPDEERLFVWQFRVPDSWRDAPVRCGINFWSPGDVRLKEISLREL